MYGGRSNEEKNPVCSLFLIRTDTLGKGLGVCFLRVCFVLVFFTSKQTQPLFYCVLDQNWMPF